MKEKIGQEKISGRSVFAPGRWIFYVELGPINFLDSFHSVVLCDQRTEQSDHSGLHQWNDPVRNKGNNFVDQKFGGKNNLFTDWSCCWMGQ